MGINVQFAEYPEVKNVNVRKEGGGDDGPIAVDVTMKGVVSQGRAELISKLTGCIPEQASAFWNPSDESVFVGIEKIEVPTNFNEGQHCKLNGIDYKGIRIRSISFVPVTKGLRLSLTVQIPGIDHGKIGDLAELIKRRTECEIYADPEMFDENDEAA